MNSKITTPIALGIIAFACVCVAVVGVLVYAGKDSGQFLAFVVMLIPSTIGLIIVSKQASDVQATTDSQTAKIDNIHANVNGKLDAKFVALHDAIEAVNRRIDLQHMKDVSDPVEKTTLKAPEKSKAKPRILKKGSKA